MTLRGLEAHHYAIRMKPGAEAETLKFFRDVLGLEPDEGAREIPDVPLFWLDVENDTQVHLFSMTGVSKYAESPERDPFSHHIALGVPDIFEARDELDRLGVDYWSAGRGERQQVFMNDPNGNMIELHQIGTCRCKSSQRPSV